MHIPTRVKLPRIWCSNPIARDKRLQTNWRRTGDPLVKYHCDVPGAGARVLWLNRAQIPLKPTTNWTAPRNTPRVEPRLPSGICSAVLATVLAIAQRQKVDTLVFPSLNDVMRACTGKSDFRNRGPNDLYTNGVWYAIRLWQVLAVKWDKGGSYLPPPFRQVDLGKPIRNGQRSITIHIDGAWLSACKSGVGVKLPLPMNAFSHNLVLATLASGNDRVDINEFGYRVSGNKLFTSRTPLVPNPTWQSVKRWYELHGGMIDYRPDPPTMVPQTRRLTPGKRMTITVIKP